MPLSLTVPNYMREREPPAKGLTDCTKVPAHGVLSLPEWERAS